MDTTKKGLCELVNQELKFDEEKDFILARLGIDKGQEKFQIFDDSDAEIYVDNKPVYMLRNECHGKDKISGVYHRGVNVFLISDGLLYLPRRSHDKDLFPGEQDISVSEHVKPHESYYDAALRGIQEELNMKVSNIDYIFTKRVDNSLNQEWAEYFKYETKNKNIIPSEEIQNGVWVEIRKLQENLDKLNFREDHLPAFREFLLRY